MHSENRIFVLDPESSVLAFRAKAFLLRWVDGTMTATRGRLVLDGDTVVAEGAVDAGSVTTGIGARDWHLRHSHYLSAKAHPTIELHVDPFPAQGGNVRGTLRTRGKEVAVDLEVDPLEITGNAARVRARGSFDRSGLGMLPPLAGVSKIIHVTLDVVARRMDATT